MPETFAIERGHCYLADMNPPRKSKPGKLRPVVVIQATDVIEAGTPGAVVVPLITRLGDEHALRVRIVPATGLELKTASDALLDQVHTLDRSLFVRHLGELPSEVFDKVVSGVRFLLDL